MDLSHIFDLSVLGKYEAQLAGMGMVSNVIKFQVLPPDDRPAALIRIAACGICGSDIPRAFAGKAYHYPLVMGHEFSGVVEEPVPGGRFARGSRVVVFPPLFLQEFSVLVGRMTN